MTRDAAITRRVKVLTLRNGHRPLRIVIGTRTFHVVVSGDYEWRGPVQQDHAYPTKMSRVVQRGDSLLADNHDRVPVSLDKFGNPTKVGGMSNGAPYMWDVLSCVEDTSVV